MKKFKQKDKISLEQECVILSTRHGKEFKFNLSEILKITAYKIDEITTDLVCFQIECRNGSKYILHEEIEGFEEFNKLLKKSLPYFDLNWEEKVIPEAFKGNETVIFQRK